MELRNVEVLRHRRWKVTSRSPPPSVSKSRSSLSVNGWSTEGRGQGLASCGNSGGRALIGLFQRRADSHRLVPSAGLAASLAALWAAPPPLTSRRLPCQVLNPHQVVDGQREGEHPADPLDPSMARVAEQPIVSVQPKSASHQIGPSAVPHSRSARARGLQPQHRPGTGSLRKSSVR